MAKVCQLTGRKPARGYKYVTRGIAKKKKGIGLKVTGKTKRRFLPNLKRQRFYLPEEKRFVSLRICTGAFRTIKKLGIGKVVSRIRAQGHKV